MGDQSNRARGRWGEDRAVAHLRRLGYRVIDRNWRPTERYVRGELDIVALDGGTVVVCEVKARRNAGFGGAVAAVDERKQCQIRQLTESWLRSWPGEFEGLRFDVIAIDGVRLEHLEGAF